MTPVITFDKVTLFYNEKLVLRDFSFASESGTVTLVLGANGAGKSSLLRLMAGLAQPAYGTISHRQNLRIGYLGHPTFIYPALTGRENLDFWARVHKLPNRKQAVENAIARSGLASLIDAPAGTYSRGMAQRLNFSRCLMLEPELLLLDEPFTGLDQDAQAQLRREITHLRSSGACIFLVSHSAAQDACLADELFTITDHAFTSQRCKTC